MFRAFFREFELMELEMVQLRYAAGVKDMLDRYFKGEDFPLQHYIVKEGELASQYRWSRPCSIYLFKYTCVTVLGLLTYTPMRKNTIN